MMNTIYKCYKGNELGDVLVAGGVVAEGSVGRALQGKHYKRGLHCLMLMHEALMSGLVKGKHLADAIREKLEILRDMGLSKDTRAAAHMALEKDTNFRPRHQLIQSREYW